MATSTIARISKRAKELRKKKPGAKWQSLIKQASKEIKAGKRTVKVTRKVVVKNRVGSKKSVASTKRVAAVGSHSNVTAQLRAELDQIRIAENKVAQLRSTSTRGMTSSEKQRRASEIKFWVKAKQMHTKNKNNLKRLV